MKVFPPIHSNSFDRGRKVSMMFVDNIDVGARHREVSDEAVTSLASSMGQIGLRTPISVWCSEDGSEMRLMTGAHRLAAAKRLGWEQIECIVYLDQPDEVDAELWEIAENLHRVELTREQRDDHIRRYAELLAEREKNQGTQVASPEIGYKKPPRQTKGVASKIAAETGLSKDTVRRALNPERTAAERGRRETAAREREAQQAEWDREREENRRALAEANPKVAAIEATKAANGSHHTASTGTKSEIETLNDALNAKVEEQADYIAALELDLAAAKTAVAKFDDMAVQFEKGGFEAVIATKDEQIRVLRGQVEDESADKAQWHRTAEFWKKQAMALGFVPSNQKVAEDLGVDVDTDLAPF